MNKTKHFKRTALPLSAKSMVSTLLLLIAMLLPQGAWAATHYDAGYGSTSTSYSAAGITFKISTLRIYNYQGNNSHFGSGTFTISAGGKTHAFNIKTLCGESEKRNFCYIDEGTEDPYKGSGSFKKVTYEQTVDGIPVKAYFSNQKNEQSVTGDGNGGGSKKWCTADLTIEIGVQTSASIVVRGDWRDYSDGINVWETVKWNFSIPAHTHVYTADYVSNNDATCLANGTKSRYCSYCNYNDKVTDAGTALGHVMTAHPAVTETCTTDGNLAYYTCSRTCCEGKIYKDGSTTTTSTYTNLDATVKKALNHNYDDDGVCKHNTSHYQPATLSGGYYLISNYGQLCWFRDYAKTTDAQAKAKLTADINLSGKAWATSIGEGTAFGGEFDGQGHVITGNARKALFCVLAAGSTVKNVVSSGATSKDNYDAAGNSYQSPFVRRNYGTIENCIVKSAYWDSRNSYLGGITGVNETGGIVRNCGFYDSTLRLRNSANTQVGGIVGVNCTNGRIENCFTWGINYYNIGSLGSGGIVCENRSGAIVSNCYTNVATPVFKQEGTATNLTSGITAAFITTGEMCYKLNAGTTNGSQVWYQKIGAETFPTPVLKNTANTVYKLEQLKCDGVTKNGSVTYSNSSTTKPTVDAHSLTATPAKAETCTEAGNNAYWTCSTCKKVFSNSTATTETTVAAQTIKAAGHGQTKGYTASYDWSGTAAEPICQFTLTCNDCKDSNGNPTVIVDEQIATTIVEANHVDATCTKKGNETRTATGSYSKAGDAAYTGTAQTWNYAISALPHTFDHHICTACSASDEELAYTGTQGECTWRIYADGEMIVSPTNGVSGSLGDWDETPSWYEQRTAIKSVRFTGSVTANTLYKVFHQCNNITSIDLTNLNTSQVQDMSYMFNQCMSLTTINWGSFDTNNATNMNTMFNYCENLTSLDLSFFNTSNVTDMNSVFQSCEKLTSVDLSSFNTGKVENFGGMFNWCYKLTNLDLSNFNTANAADMDYMFAYCKGLQSLTIGNFDMSKVTTSNDMFVSTDNLSTLTLTSVPYLKEGTFDTKFEGKTVICQLDEKSTVYKGDNPGFPTFASVTAPCTLDLTGSAVGNHANLTRTHECTVKSETETYLASAAGCGDATYYYKCAKCDEHGTETWAKAGTGTGRHTFADDDPAKSVCTVCNHGFFWYQSGDQVVDEDYDDEGNYTNFIVYSAIRLQGDLYDAEHKKLNVVKNTVNDNDGFIEFDGPIVHIGDRAFKDACINGYINLPNTTVTIGMSAFENCYTTDSGGNIFGISGVDIPNSVTAVGENAFANNDETLRSIKAPCHLDLSKVGIDWEEGEVSITRTHNYSQVEDANYRISAATCTADAVYQEKCSQCTTHGAEWTAGGTMLSHIMTEHAAQNATCTEAGNLLYYTCSQPCCSGKYYKDNAVHTANAYTNLAETVVAAAGHHYEDGTCTVCDYSVYNEVTYLDANGKQQTVEAIKLNADMEGDFVTTDELGNYYLASGWYYVEGELNLNNYLYLKGGDEVNIILTDGCKWTLNRNINVSVGATLNIYCQSQKTGTVAMGAYSLDNNGEITINGGNFTSNTHALRLNTSATATINGGSFSGDEFAVYADTKTKVIINGGTFKGRFFGALGYKIVGNNVPYQLGTGTECYNADTNQKVDLEFKQHPYDSSRMVSTLNTYIVRKTPALPVEVPYLDASGKQQTAQAFKLTANMQGDYVTTNQWGEYILASGWYYVEGELDLSEALKVQNGQEVNIILTDGCQWTLKSLDLIGGIDVFGGATLNFYWQSQKTGTQKIVDVHTHTRLRDNATVNVYGGNFVGNDDTYAVFDAWRGGNLHIFDANVSGQISNCSIVTIDGGTFKAGNYALHNDWGTINLNGGTFTGGVAAFAYNGSDNTEQTFFRLGSGKAFYDSEGNAVNLEFELSNEGCISTLKTYIVRSTSSSDDDEPASLSSLVKTIEKLKDTNSGVTIEKINEIVDKLLGKEKQDGGNTEDMDEEDFVW